MAMLLCFWTILITASLSSHTIKRMLNLSGFVLLSGFSEDFTVLLYLPRLKEEPERTPEAPNSPPVEPWETKNGET